MTTVFLALHPADLPPVIARDHSYAMVAAMTVPGDGPPRKTAGLMLALHMDAAPSAPRCYACGRPPTTMWFPDRRCR